MDPKSARGSSSNNDINNHYNNTYERHCHESAVQDAVVASTAIMGEAILDSPDEPRKMYSPGRGVSSFLDDTNSPRAPSLNAGSSNNHAENNGSSSGSSYRGSNDRMSSAQTEGLSVGIMAQGLSWARKQKERRQRQYLQAQADQQLRKIKVAQAEKAATTVVQQRSLLDNPTFQNIMHYASSSAVPKMACSFDPPLETGEGKDKAATTHSGNNKMATTTTKQVSKSGGGYSVQLAVDDYGDDGLAAVEQRADTYNKEDDASFIPTVRIVERDDVAAASPFAALSTTTSLSASLSPPTSPGVTSATNNNDVTQPPPFLLTPDERQQIAHLVLPRGIAYAQWIRLHSLARDGDSFDNCLRHVRGHTHTLTVVRTARHAVLGALADAPWESRGSGPTYYGGAGACLFKVMKQPVVGGDESSSSSTVRAYHWSGQNRYVQLCDASQKMIAFGGGGDDGAFGLYLANDFQVGSTGPCATFENEPLCDQENFTIVDMEIYGFLVGHF